MFRSRLLFSFLTLSICAATAGCGSGGNDAPSDDEVTQFLDDNPQLLKDSEERARREREEALMPASTAPL